LVRNNVENRKTAGLGSKYYFERSEKYKVYCPQGKMIRREPGMISAQG